tara:strand:+ start:3320 stop:4189 length:870 start_codon:yes stop_codon:yes gene_type:complete
MLPHLGRCGHGGPKIAEILSEYRSDQHLRINSTSASQAQGTLKKFIFHQSIKSPADITRQAVTNYLAAQKAAGLAPRTLIHYLSAVRAFCEFLVDSGHLATNPAARVRVKAPLTTPPNYLTDDQVRQCLAVSAAYGWGWPVKLALNTGMRKMELIAAEIGHIHFTDKTISTIGKGGRHRVIPLNDSIMADLQILRDCGLGGRLIVNHSGRVMSQATFEKRLYPIQEKLPVITGYHIFRHTWATQLYRSGTPLELIAQWLGHANIKTTLDHYANLGHVFNDNVNNWKTEA